MNTDNEATEPLGHVGHKESERILQLLDEAIVQSRRSRREIERSLGWSQGYLGSLLRGRIGLKVWHVFALARELGREPLSFFFIAAPPRDPNWILEQLGVPLPDPEEAKKPKKKLPPMDRDELEALVKDLLHHELERAGLLNIYREPYSEDADFDMDLDLSLKAGEPKTEPEPEPAHSR